jgi:integrase/recombinase XerD
VYAKWCHERPHDAFDVTPLDVEDYLLHLSNDKEYAYQTVSVHQSALSKFFETAEKLVDGGRIDATLPSENPVEEVSLKDVTTTTKTKKEQALEGSEDRHGLPPEKVDEIANAVPSPTVRNELLVRLMYQGMLRRKEVARLKLDDIDRDNRSITIRSDVAKNGESRTVYYMPTLDRLMRLWWDIDRDSYALADESDYLFLSNEREHLSRFHVGQIVVRAAENSGHQSVLYTAADGTEKNTITAHTLRHSGAVRRWSDDEHGNGGADLRTLQKLLGHQSIKTTETYLDVGDDDLAQKARNTW